MPTQLQFVSSIGGIVKGKPIFHEVTLTATKKEAQWIIKLVLNELQITKTFKVFDDLHLNAVRETIVAEAELWLIDRLSDHYNTELQADIELCGTWTM